MASHCDFLPAFLASMALMGWLGHSFVVPPHAQPMVAGARPPPSVRVQEDLVTANLEEVPVAEVLQEISRQSGIKVVLHSSRQARVSAESRSVPLEQALRRLIKENFLLLYSPDHRLAEAWVLDRSHLSSSRIPAIHAPGQSLPSGQRGSFNSLIVRAKDEDVEHRGRAVLRLGEFQDERALASVIGTLQGDDDAGVRERAVWALEDLGGQRATAALVEALSGDDDDTVRRRAVEALAKIGGPETLEPITRALREDPDRFVRYEALVNLAEIGGNHVLGSLIMALDDPDELIWAKAEELLAMQGNGGREP
jgi:HEAT repeats